MFTVQLMLHHVTLDPQKTVSYFAKRCEQILDLAVKWAPTETKTILEVRRGIPQPRECVLYFKCTHSLNCCEVFDAFMHSVHSLYVG